MEDVGQRLEKEGDGGDGWRNGRRWDPAEIWRDGVSTGKVESRGGGGYEQNGKSKQMEKVFALGDLLSPHTWARSEPSFQSATPPLQRLEAPPGYRLTHTSGAVRAGDVTSGTVADVAAGGVAAFSSVTHTRDGAALVSVWKAHRGAGMNTAQRKEPHGGAGSATVWTVGAIARFFDGTSLLFSLHSGNYRFKPNGCIYVKEKRGEGPVGDGWIQVLFAQSDVFSAANPSLNSPNFIVKAFSQPFP